MEKKKKEMKMKDYQSLGEKMSAARASTASSSVNREEVDFKCPVCELCMLEKKEDTENILQKLSVPICSRCRKELGSEFFVRARQFFNGLIDIFEKNEAKEETIKEVRLLRISASLFFKQEEGRVGDSLFYFMEEFYLLQKLLKCSFYEKSYIAECKNKDCVRHCLSIGEEADMSMKDARKKMQDRRCEKCGSEFMVYLSKPSPHRY